MKVSIDTSNFSFRFIGVCFIVLALVCVIFSWMLGAIFLILALLFLLQKYTYLIPRPSTAVLAQTEKTLKSLKVEYQKTRNTVSTKRVAIQVYNCHFFTLLRFTFEKVYTVQGKYLAGVVSKYQRYR